MRFLTFLMCTGCIGIKKYSIVKVNVTEVNTVIKSHSNVITIGKMSTTEVISVQK